MYGKVIGTSIAVDCFHEATKNCIHFLTEGWLDCPLPSYVFKVYTSILNKQLLIKYFDVDPDKIFTFTLNSTFLFEDKIRKCEFYVTLMNSNQKPGAVMFRFEGKDIGNVIYAGKCFYGKELFSIQFREFLKTKQIDYLYVHDTCNDCHLHSCSKSGAIEEILSIIRQNPNSKILINEPCFRLDILTELERRIKGPIYLSQNMMKHLNNITKSSEGFTLDQSEAQVFVSDKFHDLKNLADSSCLKIILIPCSLRWSSHRFQMKLNKLGEKGYHVIIYRNHCSPPELIRLTNDINAKHTILIRPPSAESHSATKTKDLAFWSHLGNISRLMSGLDRFNSEYNKVYPINQYEEINEDLPKSVEDITEEEEFCHDAGTSDNRSEANTPQSFILIDSDNESITSLQTVLNA